MNLYLLTQEENTGYDTYDSAVVAAENEEQAKSIRPDNWGSWDDSWNSWASSPKNVKAELIGTSVERGSPGVIIASYNAG